MQTTTDQKQRLYLSYERHIAVVSGQDMKVGTIVKGKIRYSEFGVKFYMPGSPNHDSLLAHKLGMFAATADTIELWEPSSVYGMIAKIEEDITGYGPKFALVLLERKTIWFLLEDLEVVLPPK